MKIILSLIGIASVAVLVHGLSDDDRTKVKNVHAECQADPATHLDEAILKKFHKGDDVDKAVVGPHILCMSKKLGLIDAEGKVNTANLRKALSRGISDDAKLTEAVDKCSVEKDTPEQTSLSLLKCFREHVDQGLHGNHDH